VSGTATVGFVVASMLDTWRTLVRTNGAETFERPGVYAFATPDLPQRSLFNSAGYTDPAAFLAAREELAEWYGGYGVAWTVWAPEGDGDVREELEAAGHELDAAPRAMFMDLADAQQPEMAGIDWSEGDIPASNSINDRSYGWPDGTWSRFNSEDAAELRTYVARVDGEPAATVATIDHGSDCEVWSVATLPQARGRGLCTALMRQGLWDAREGGCETSTLQATADGRPIYERLGYADLGALQMWELRPPELAGEANRKPLA
jgi:ribosomal protein S18 acetylase RimI-like enzyme